MLVLPLGIRSWTPASPRLREQDLTAAGSSEAA
jgi:hypothetical protein